MVNTNKIDKYSYTNKIIKMYEELNIELTKDIIKRINNVDTSFTRSQLRTLARNGGKEIFKEALKKTNKLNATRKKEILKLFEDIIKDDLRDYKELYEYRDKEFKITEGQYKIIKKMTRLTDKELKNFTKTIAFSSQKEFVDAMDKLYFQVVTNSIDNKTAFKNITNDLASKGITLPMKDGRNRSIEAAVRQNMIYGIKQTAQQVENDLAKELDADGVQINITPNCRHEHQVINGEIFSLKRGKSKYPYFSRKYSSLLEDFGCQHYTSPYIIGISEPIYTQKDIKKAQNRVVSYKGDQIPYYDATQKQRALERQIRNAKRIYLSNPTKENKLHINNTFKKYRDYCKETGLEEDRDRTFYAGYNK